jgi:site-specific DNA recombinase
MSGNPSPGRLLKCAPYGRKSTEEGLEQEFNSLDAQWESSQAYIKSQASEGWVSVPTRYEDGGYTGGNLDRPGLRRLLADIEAGKIDIVVVYKVDRLSRSLLDFSKLLEVFEKHRVGFVSVTQQFSTTTSAGRLMLNVLLSFSQFERELISERTRDKMSAARRKGKWLGGKPVLGYDVDPATKKLVVNDGEAARVRTIYQLYSEHQALLPVVQELLARGWVNKLWSSKKGKSSGGLPFNKTSLHYLLTNPTYIGQVVYKTEVHAGEQAAIIDPATWQRVQSLLKRNGSTGGASIRNKFGAILKGRLFCKACDCAMSPSHSTRGNKRYRYYLCNHAGKNGWDTCPSKSIPAAEIEKFVLGHLRELVNNPAVIAETVAQVQAQRRDQLDTLNSERRGLERDLAHWNRELHDVVLAPNGGGPHATARLADLQDRIRTTERRLTDVHAEVTALDRTDIDAATITAALTKFDPVWEVLTPREQTRLVELLVSRVDYDGASGKVAITFRADAVPLLAKELTDREEAA